MRGILRGLALSAILFGCVVGGVFVHSSSQDRAHLALTDLTAVSQTFTGIVTDAMNRPIPNVPVSANGIASSTDATGRYSVSCMCGPTVTVSVSTPVVPESQNVTAVTPGTYEVDFPHSLYLLYANGVAGMPAGPTPATSLPATQSLGIKTSAPANGLCIEATDSRTGNTVSMANTTPSSWFGPWSQWSGTLDVPAGTSSGAYAVTYFRVDCASGTQLTWHGDGSYHYNVTPYYVDLVRPSATITMPVVGHTTVGGQDVGISPDGQTRVVGLLNVQYVAADDAQLSSATITVTSSDGSSTTTTTQYLSGRSETSQASFAVSPGKWTITVIVTSVGGLVSSAVTERFVEVSS